MTTTTPTHTPAEIAAAAGYVLAHLDRRADNPAAVTWAGAMRDARGQTGPASIRAWLESHTGAEIEALQATVHPTGDLTRVWTPGPRTVATRATFATLDGSRREYAGVRTVWASADAYVGYDVDMRAVIVYRRP